MNAAAQVPPGLIQMAALARQRWEVDPDALTATMARRKITGPDLAARAHMSTSRVRQLRNGIYPTTTGLLLIAMCEVLGCVPDMVATRVEDAL